MHYQFLITLLAIVFTSLPCVVFAADLSTESAPEVQQESANDDRFLVITAGEQEDLVDIESYHKLVDISSYFTIDPSYSREIESHAYCPNYKEPCNLRATIRDRQHIRHISHITVDRTLASQYLDDIAQKMTQEPIDAILTSDGASISVAQKHVNGFRIDPEKNLPLFIESLQSGSRTITLEPDFVFAAVRSDNIKELGLETIIGEGRSNFAGSSVNRIHNIQTAAARFDDMLIAPGETFSFVANLGAVDGTTGYRKELVIKNNQTIPEYGGGVCQVSTTIFRGAIFSGMKITERRNHSYPVKYYEPMGFDATIYLPAPDMKFTNNTKGYILLDTKIEGTELVFRYFGRDDGRQVAMNGPVVTSRGTDGSAKTYFTQTVKDASGNVLIDDTFYSNYKSPKAYPRADVSIGN